MTEMRDPSVGARARRPCELLVTLLRPRRLDDRKNWRAAPGVRSVSQGDMSRGRRLGPFD